MPEPDPRVAIARLRAMRSDRMSTGSALLEMTYERGVCPRERRAARRMERVLMITAVLACHAAGLAFLLL